jgi:hypothetical protein
VKAAVPSLVVPVDIFGKLELSAAVEDAAFLDNVDFSTGEYIVALNPNVVEAAWPFARLLNRVDPRALEALLAGADQPEALRSAVLTRL